MFSFAEVFRFQRAGVRQLMHLLGCRRLLIHNQNGITIQTDCATIACLVIPDWTGRKPTKRTHEMVCFHLMGCATTDEVEAPLAKWKLAEASPRKTPENDATGW